jgi:peroxiredoxin Q/BCP
MSNLLDIEVLNHNNQSVTLRSYLSGANVSQNKPKYLVLYFYPKDNTPGCTTEACEFRDATADLVRAGALVLGVSADSVDSHQKFASKHSLSFELLSDPEHKLLEAFGVWGEKKFMGKLFMGVTRSTFLLDSSGKTIKAWHKVKSVGHAQEVLVTINSLK